MPQNHVTGKTTPTSFGCDWVGCLETGFFDALQKTILNAEGRKNIIETRRTFVFLCSDHIKLAVGSSEK